MEPILGPFKIGLILSILLYSTHPPPHSSLAAESIKESRTQLSSTLPSFTLKSSTLCSGLYDTDCLYTVKWREMVSHTPKPKHHQQISEQCTESTQYTSTIVYGLKRTLITAHVWSTLPSPSPSPWTKILIDGLLNRVELRRAERNRVLLSFIDSGPGYPRTQGV